MVPPTSTGPRSGPAGNDARPMALYGPGDAPHGLALSPLHAALLSGDADIANPRVRVQCKEEMSKSFQHRLRMVLISTELLVVPHDVGKVFRRFSRSEADVDV